MSDSPVILITGASSGIGAATAREFGRSGYRIVLSSRDDQKLETIAKQILAEGGTAISAPVDVSLLEEIQSLVQIVLEEYGRIDILFNNAGIGQLNWLEQLDPRKDISKMLAVNLQGMIWMAQAVLPCMIKQRYGHIINMISASALVAPPMYTIYSASKFGMRGFTEALRREVGIYGIRVSGIYPGGVATSFAQEAIKERKTGLHTPFWLCLKPEDVAKKVLWLTQHPRRMVVMPRILWLAYALNIFFPGIVDKGIEWVFVRRERD